MNRLAGKTALITGAARGIGFAFAKTYVNEGARVAIADINFDRAKSAASELGENCIAIEMDVTSQTSIDSAIVEAPMKQIILSRRRSTSTADNG